MQKFTVTAIVTLIALTLASPLGVARHVECMGVVTEVHLEAEKLYIDDRSSLANPFNHWFYLESGAQEGLQTGGSDSLGLSFYDACDHGSNRDILLL